MAFNPMALMKLKGMWQDFNAAHPKLMPFFRAAGNGYLGEGTVAEITVTAPDGRNIRCNIKLTAKDMEMMNEIAKLGGSV